MPIVIYHNPKCSKSRQALAYLREKGHEPDVVTYLDAPPNADEMAELLGLLGLEPREAMRTKEKEYREFGLADASLSRGRLIEAMVSHPRLIERPIVVNGDRAVIARPTERIDEVL